MAVTDFVSRPLPDGAKKDISTFIECHAVLVSVLQVSDALTPGITPEPLFQEISRKLNVPRLNVQAIFTTLANLNILQDEIGNIDDALAYVQSNLSGEQAKLWEEHRGTFLEVVRTYSEDNPVAISQKAHRLSYEHEKLLARADILTDARPVFDSAGLKIVEVVITHMLALTYISGRVSKNVHIAVDADDVIKLRKACERAIAKAQTLKITLSSHQLAATVLNESEEGQNELH